MGEGKVIPLRCEACGQIVGSVRALVPTDIDTPLVESEMTLEQHLEDCPFLEALSKNTLTSLSIGAYGAALFDGGDDAG